MAFYNTVLEESENIVSKINSMMEDAGKRSWKDPLIVAGWHYLESVTLPFYKEVVIEEWLRDSTEREILNEIVFTYRLIDKVEEGFEKELKEEVV